MKKQERPAYASLLLVALPLLGGTTNERPPDQELGKTHSLIIVPFRGTPAMIVAKTGWFSVVAPIVYAGAEKAGRGGRQEKVALLNEEFGRWEPGVVVAQECARLIENSKTSRIENVAISDTRESRHSEKLREKDSGVFSVKERTIYKWIAVGKKWHKGDRSEYYRAASASRDAEWALEIFISTLTIREKKTILQANMKLLDLAAGQVIAATGGFEASFKFDASFELKEASDFLSYMEQFQDGAQQACSAFLSKAGLIAPPA